MTSIDAIKYYSPLEEKINISSHALGLFLSIIAILALVVHASINGNIWHIISFTIFGMSLIVLYSASTYYHSTKSAALRQKMRIIDHASIYVLIAGTYTPYTLVTLKGTTGWLIFSIIWGLALSGIILKIFFTGRFKLLSTSMYLFMGWMIVFAINPLIDNLHPDGLQWLIIGGIAYTVGAVLYGIKKIKLNHAIFHIFVLLGSFSHFISIFFYVLPHN